MAAGRKFHDEAWARGRAGCIEMNRPASQAAVEDAEPGGEPSGGSAATKLGVEPGIGSEKPARLSPCLRKLATGARTP
jgi:hypothetical protein